MTLTAILFPLLFLILVLLCAGWYLWPREKRDQRVLVRKSGDSDPEPQRRLKNVDVQFISLVGKGANNKTIVYKSGAGGDPNLEKVVKIRKTDPVKKLVYGIVYAPDEVDAQGDTMEATEIEKAAHSFLQKGRTTRVDKDHDEQPDEGYVVESYLIGKSDSRFPDDPEGSWAVVIKVTDDDTWSQIQDGDIQGISMQATANVEQLSKSAAEQTRGFFTAMLDEIKKGVRQMTTVNKSFKDRMAHNEMHRAILALEESLRQSMNDDDIQDKAAAMQADLDAFSNYINNEITKSMDPKKTNNSAASAEDVSKTTTSEPSAGQAHADHEQLRSDHDALVEKNKELTDRIAELEKSAPGRQSDEGRDDPPASVKKALPIFRNFD